MTNIPPSCPEMCITTRNRSSISQVEDCRAHPEWLKSIDQLDLTEDTQRGVFLSTRAGYIEKHHLHLTNCYSLYRHFASMNPGVCWKRDLYYLIVAFGEVDIARGHRAWPSWRLVFLHPTQACSFCDLISATHESSLMLLDISNNYCWSY